MKSLSEKFIKVELSRFYRLIHPRFTVLISSESNGVKGVMTAAWITPVSINPPIVAVSISPKRETFKLIVKSGEFSVNVLSMNYLSKVHLAGTISARRVKDKFKRVGLTPGKARRIGSPIVLEADAVLECVVWRTIEAGDHVMFLGRVVESYASEKFEEVWNVEEFKPILHVGENAYTSVSEVVRV